VFGYYIGGLKDPECHGGDISMARFGGMTRGWILAGLLLSGPAIARAQEPAAGHDATELAKASQNPVGDLISLPFQFNFNSGGGFEDRTFFNLNFQPVMPIKVTQAVNLIARTIVPVVSIPAPEGLRFSGVAQEVDVSTASGASV